jgi:hypothetical protein
MKTLKKRMWDMSKGGVELGVAVAIEKGNVTTVEYNDGQVEVYETVGEFALHPLGWVALRRPGGKPPILVNQHSVKRFFQDPAPETPTLHLG